MQVKLYRTRAAAERRIRTLAELCGIEAPELLLTKREMVMAYVKAWPKFLGGWREWAETRTAESEAVRTWRKVQRHYRGMSFRVLHAVWVALPVSEHTLAEEVNHLRTKTAHRTEPFEAQLRALAQNNAPTVRLKPYVVTVTTVQRYEVRAMNANDAKEVYRRSSPAKQTTTITARKQS